MQICKSTFLLSHSPAAQMQVQFPSWRNCTIQRKPALINVWIWLNKWEIELNAINQSKLPLIQLIMYSAEVEKSKWNIFFTCESNESLTLNGSHDVDPVMYVDVRRPTIERHPIELERRPEVRSVGTGSILILCRICADCVTIEFDNCYFCCFCRCSVDISLYCSMIFSESHWSIQVIHVCEIQFQRTLIAIKVYFSIIYAQSVVYALHSST